MLLCPHYLKPPPDWEIIYFNEMYNSSLTHIIRGIYTYRLLFWQLNERTVSLITGCVGQVTGWVCTCLCVSVFGNYMTIKYSAADPLQLTPPTFPRPSIH